MAKARKAKKPAATKAARKPARKAGPARKASAPRKSAAPKYKNPGAQDVITQLTVRDAASAIEFYKKALGAEERARHPAPDGKSIWHAELKIGDTIVAINDEMQGGPGFVTAAGPNHKPTSSFMLYVPDCDVVFNAAVQAGGRAAMPLADMFWGDRMGAIADPYGQVWMVATHKKDMTFEQQRKAGEEFAAQMAQQGQGAPPSAEAH
ncbi:MAG: VOC family protein [Myxococcales bacterium]|nr:VOC family protein [Myxococcales bacterium]